jgi:ribosomal protein S18 acetylase RimI-like enzyme
MMDAGIELWRPETLDRAALDRDIAGLARMLHATVHAGASINFLLPFTVDDAAAFWREKVLPSALAGERRVLIVRMDGTVAGTVQLVLATPPNQQHRTEIVKLLVDPDYRHRGIARALMVAAEDQARLAGRTLITLDTRTGDTAEPLYLALGYVLVGVIPRYSRHPHTPALEGASFLYKELL